VGNCLILIPVILEKRKMDVSTAKSEFHELVDQMPDELLLKLLKLAKELNELSSIDTQTAIDLADIMNEDDEVLKKLAQ
jgi:hypothetical protein